MLAELVAELGPRWQARQDARLADRPRRRAVGAGAKHRLVFLDRLLVTLVHLRHAVTHDVLAWWFGVSRSTITRAVGGHGPMTATGQVRPASAMTSGSPPSPSWPAACCSAPWTPGCRRAG
nr:transposase family protein [Geodermatophilus amargosae]